MKKISIVDLCKLFFAFCIIGIHTKILNQLSESSNWFIMHLVFFISAKIGQYIPAIIGYSRRHFVDAVVIWEPNVSRLDATDKIHILTHGGDIGFPGVNVVFARQEFVKANPDIVKAYLQQYWRATKAYEMNPKEYADLLSKYFKLDSGLVSKAASKYDYVLKFDKTEVDGLQDTVSFLVKNGSIKKEIQVKNYVEDAIAKSVISEAK